MTDISLKEAISFAFKKVRENFFLFVKLGIIIPLMVIGFIVLITVGDRLALKFLGPIFHDPFISIIISIILIPFFILIFVLAINAELIRVSLNLINNESDEFKIKLDKQTKKFSLISSLLGLLSSFSPVLLYLFLIYSGLDYSIESRIFYTHDPYFIFFAIIAYFIISYSIFFIIYSILFSRLVFYGHLIIDKNLGIKESFKKSFMLTKYLTKNLRGLFRLLVLSVLYLIALLGVYIIIIPFYFFLDPFPFHSYLSLLIYLIIILVPSFITPILFLIVSYFYKRLIDQAEEKNLL
jgi:hypothetical protein